ncbi:MAG TPA: 2-oxoglutarate and iron-dependent oxygenase domain-containing protein, partial [Streptomyces sp.]
MSQQFPSSQHRSPQPGSGERGSSPHSARPSRLQLPVIDLSAATSGESGARARLRADLHQAAHGTGFFQLTGHGVTAAETDTLMTAVRSFFALPEADRLAVSNLNSPHFRGYTRIGDEHTGGSRDWRDQLDIGAER